MDDLDFKKTFDSSSAQYWLEKDNLDKIRKWARDGLILEQLAHNMGIARATLYNWKNKYPEIDEAWNDGKIAADLEVINAMFKSATGYRTQEVVQELDEAGNLIVTKVTDKDVAANVTAQAMWIKNRMPNFMKDNQLTETYRKKVEAETEKIKLESERTRLQNDLLKGVAKDTTLLDALANAFKMKEGD